MGSYKWGFIRRATVVITQVRGLITPLITTHKPPSSEDYIEENRHRGLN